MLTQPDEAARLSPDQVRNVLGKVARFHSLLAGLQATLLATMPSADEEHAGEPMPLTKGDKDLLFGKEEAARRLGMTTQQLVRRHKDLPFVRKLGHRTIRYSAAGIERYLRSRGGN
jgi:hypothetical protein